MLATLAALYDSAGLTSSASFGKEQGLWWTLSGHCLDTVDAKRAVVLLCAVATAALVVALAVVASKPARAATDRLPDLGMARFTNIQIQNASGQRLLRFDTKIANTGSGRLRCTALAPPPQPPP